MKFECVPWSDEAEAGLLDAAKGHINEVKKRVLDGKASVYKVIHDTCVSWMTLYNDADGVLYIECYQGSEYLKFCRAMCERAKELGINKMRFATTNKKIVSVWQRVGKGRLTALPSRDDYYYEVSL